VETPFLTSPGLKKGCWWIVDEIAANMWTDLKAACTQIVSTASPQEIFRPIQFAFNDAVRLNSGDRFETAIRYVTYLPAHSCYSCSDIFLEPFNEAFQRVILFQLFFYFSARVNDRRVVFPTEGGADIGIRQLSQFPG
jgi:hypothetical protein